jgi:hypothetical protein
MSVSASETTSVAGPALSCVEAIELGANEKSHCPAFRKQAILMAMEVGFSDIIPSIV